LLLDRNFFDKPGILKETVNMQLSILYGAGIRTQAGESTQPEYCNRTSRSRKKPSRQKHEQQEQDRISFYGFAFNNHVELSVSFTETGAAS
jgi:hypothetical protein